MKIRLGLIFLSHNNGLNISSFYMLTQKSPVGTIQEDCSLAQQPCRPSPRAPWSYQKPRPCSLLAHSYLKLPGILCPQWLIVISMQTKRQTQFSKMPTPDHIPSVCLSHCWKVSFLFRPDCPKDSCPGPSHLLKPSSAWALKHCKLITKMDCNNLPGPTLDSIWSILICSQNNLFFF